MTKLLIYVCMFFLFCGCRTKKEVATNTVTVHTSDTVLHYRDRIQKDTVVRIAERQVHDTFNLTDTVVHYVQGKGINLKVQKQADGRISVQCNADSLMLIIQNLLIQKDTLSIAKAKLEHQSEIKETTKTSWLEDAGSYIITAVVGLIIGVIAGGLLIKKIG